VSFGTLTVLIAALLIAAFFLTLFSAAFRRIHKKSSQKYLKNLGFFFFYSPLHSAFFATYEHEGIFFSIISAQYIIRFSYAAVVSYGLTQLDLLGPMGATFEILSRMGISVAVVAFVLLSFFVGDYLPRVLGTRQPERALSWSAPVASLLMAVVFPLTYLFLSVLHIFGRTIYFDHLQEPSVQAKQELIEIIQETDLHDSLTSQDKKLIASVLGFRKHIAREVMVPRVEVFGLAAEVSIREAAASLQAEGYSRVPVYRSNMDNIVGVLMYKDVLQKFMEYEQAGNHAKILSASVESIMKAPLYTPETKRISNLLQEFRKKQVHMAIVVDEYGGTEGIVTIEDILERIVGEIADEYDDEEGVFFTQTEGGWIVDARMSILDAAEQLGVKIPQEGDYDTIGGYLFHCAGSIPARGFMVHCDEFEMVVLRSTDRYVERVRIKPLLKKESNGEEL
jgi:CBS domain containing-hemolysin-like protein